MVVEVLIGLIQLLQKLYSMSYQDIDYPIQYLVWSCCFIWLCPEASSSYLVYSYLLQRLQRVRIAITQGIAEISLSRLGESYFSQKLTFFLYSSGFRVPFFKRREGYRRAIRLALQFSPLKQCLQLLTYYLLDFSPIVRALSLYQDLTFLVPLSFKQILAILGQVPSIETSKQSYSFNSY